MGVLNDYPNAAAVNDALNKGVEANSAVGELKSDLVNIKDVTVVVKESKNLFNRNDEDYKPNTIYDTSGAEK